MNSRIRLDRSAAGETAPAGRYSLSEKINVCRGLFALLVVSSHAWGMAHLIDPSWRGAPSALRDAIGSVAGEGLYYMMGFFAISGYCIQVSARRLAVDGRFPLKTYMIARLTRILPLYYVALVVALIVESLAGPHRITFWTAGITRAALFAQVLVVQGFTQPFGSFAPSWSITSEFLYYLMFGLLAAATAATARSRFRPSVVGLFATIGLAVGCAVLSRTGLRSPVVFRASELFGMGAIWFLGAIAADRADDLPRSPIIRRASACWPLILVLAMVMWYGQWMKQRNVYLTSGIAFTLMLVRFIIQEHDAGPAQKRRPRPYTEAFGLASYPVYLLHGPILRALERDVRRHGGPGVLVAVLAAGDAALGRLRLGRRAADRTPGHRLAPGVLERLKQSSTSTRLPGPITAPSVGVPQ